MIEIAMDDLERTCGGGPIDWRVVRQAAVGGALVGATSGAGIGAMTGAGVFSLPGAAAGAVIGGVAGAATGAVGAWAHHRLDVFR